MKSQTLFSQFDPVAGWVGSLGDVTNLESYALKLSTGGTIVHEGTAVAVSTTAVPVANGWNWIPYLPQGSLAINTTLQLLGPQNGDVVKSQTQFAQYVKSGSVASWIGDLKTMNPGLGYRMFLSNASVIQNQFKYFVPAGQGGILPVAARPGTGAPSLSDGVADAPADPSSLATLKTLGPDWSVDARAYPYNMTVTGVLEAGGVPLDDDRYVVAAMVGTEVRGLAKPQYVDGVNKYLVFLMVYGKENESAPVTFRVFDTAHDVVRDVDGSIAFSPDLVSGSITQPFAMPVGGIAPGGAAVPVEFALGQNQPNPPKGQVLIRFAVPTTQHVVLKLHDVAGREVKRLVDGVHEPGNYSVTLDVSALKSGIYFYRMEAGHFVQSRKMAVVN